MKKPQLVIISSSVRKGRKSHRVAQFLERFIAQEGYAGAEVLDLMEYNFPLFEERLKYLEAPGEEVKSFAGKIKQADGVIIVTPEYNGGYPAALKNVIDLMYMEWKRKPVGLVAVSSGSFGGSQVLTSLVFTLWKIGALMVPAMMQVAQVGEQYSEAGEALNKEDSEKHAKRFLTEMLWLVASIRQNPANN